MTPIRLAILGSGLFVRDAHLPALKTLSDSFEVVAIYGRNAGTAESLAATLPGTVDIYTDLAAVLARTDIDAVDVVMPIAQQPEVVTDALKARKHVISEKSIAPSLPAGQRLLNTARVLTAESGRIWMVAENWRYEVAYQKAGDTIRSGDIGQPIQFNWATAVEIAQTADYNKPWLRDNSVPGGFILAGGVHNVAAMRLVMGEIASVGAFVTQVRPDLPPIDTLSATFRFDSGAFGSWTMTYATGSPWDNPIQILGSSGALLVNRKQLDIFTQGERRSYSFDVNSIYEELADFARVINGEPLRNSPEQALQDVAVIHAILESARTGCAVQPERIV